MSGETLPKRWVSLRYIARTLISLLPFLYMSTFPKVNPLGADRLVAANTVLVVEGFPRSANTWLTAFFELILGPHAHIAHHTHAAAQVRRGVALRIPVVVPIRAPYEAVSSLVVRTPGLSLSAALIGYIAFHLAIWDVAKRCVVASFDTATRRPTVVLDALNLALPQETAAPDDEAVRARVSEMHLRPDLNRGVSAERGLAIPHEGRGDLVAALEQHRRSLRVRALLWLAEKIYARYAARSL